MIIMLDGFSFAYGGGASSIDDDGVEWVAETFTGWWSRPAPRTARSGRSSGAGSFRGPAWTGERIITVAGTLTAPNQQTMLNAKRRLAAICTGSSGLYELAVYDDSDTTTADIEIDGEILTEFIDWRSCRWSLQFAAPDPRKHAYVWQSPACPLPSPGVGAADFSTPGVSFSGGVDFGTAPVASTVTITNTGTAPAHPLFTIVAVADACTNPVITEVSTGNTPTYAGTLATGDQLQINTDDFAAQGVPGHGVVLNGTRNQRALLRLAGDWPMVPPGESRSYRFDAGSGTTATLAVQLRSAWH